MGAAPGRAAAAECAAPQRRLLFSRDRAGWNNVRITFESLACAARLTERVLVLPPPSRIEHLSGALFHELRVYDVPRLAGAVRFEAAAAEPPREAARFEGPLPQLLALHGRGEDREADLVVTARLQHFECLVPPEAPGRARRAAAQTVLALRLAAPYHEAARSGLARAGLAPGGYHAVHLRRGDFRAFRPATQRGGAELAALVRRAFPAAEADLPLLVASDGREDDDAFPALLAALPRRRVLRAAELHGAHDGPLLRAVLDTLLLALARRFAGTPDSTFSAGVWHWRAHARALAGQAAELPASLGGGAAQESEGQCWRRCSTFGALRG